MQSNSVFEFGAVCLGAIGNTASWQREKQGVARPGRWRPMVIVQTSSDMDEGAHKPAESVTIGGVESLLALRAALELIATPQRPDGTWNRDREACRELAAEALGRYDDSKTPNV